MNYNKLQVQIKDLFPSLEEIELMLLQKDVEQTDEQKKDHD